MRQPPDIVIQRLALYLRFLEDYVKETESQATINSEFLARQLHVNPHQIRKDLSHFGKFGERGIGYDIEDLKQRIRAILGLQRSWNICICGVGNLGSALLAYRGFRGKNLKIVAAFDTDARKIGKRKQGVRIYHIRDMQSVVDKVPVDIAIITAPASDAQEIADALITAGVRAILNFAPIKLRVPSAVKLRTVDLSTELMNLTYFLCAVA